MEIHQDKVTYRALGRTGLIVSSIALGTGNFADPTPAEECARILGVATEAGINIIDTADVYADGECERIVGKVLQAMNRRDDFVIMTKSFYSPGTDLKEGEGRDHLIRSCEASLQRLKTDRIELYLIHRPSFDISPDEILRALDDLVRQGKVIHIGTSTHPAWKVIEGIMISELKGYAKYVAESPPYNLLDRRIENELTPMCRMYDLAVLPWAPTAMGLLTGRYRQFGNFPKDSRVALRGGDYAQRVTQVGIEVSDRFRNLAGQCGIPPAQLALLWVKDQPGITAPIFGPRSAEQLRHIIPVMDMQLPEDVRVACDALVPPGSAVANFHNNSGWMK